MRILVIQTTRMGDVVQTSPLVHELREQYPDAHIAFMVRRMGKTIAEHHPDADEIIIYDEDEMFLNMRPRDSGKLLAAYRNAESIIDTVREKKFDAVYNVTHSIASAMLIKLAEIPEVTGAHMTDDWQYVQRGLWTRYFFTSIFSREYNDLNLCDIFRNFPADAPPCKRLFFEVREEEAAFADALLADKGIEKDDFLVCMQLGASEANKRWAAQHFAGLAKMLHEKYNAKIMLPGVESEAEFGEAFEAAAPGLAIHLFGKTDLAQLAALLRRARLLVTNDTGTMHVAAAAGCPVTLISVGHVHYRETGPWGEGHCAVELRRKQLGRSDFVPGGLEERERIRPEQVMYAVARCLAAAEGKSPAQLEEAPALEEIDIFETRFAPDGCLQFYPVIRRKMQRRDFLRTAYRAMWLHHLNGRRDSGAETESITRMLGQYSGPDAATVSGWEKEDAEIFHGLAALARKGVKATEQLLDILRKNKGMGRAREVTAELMRIDEETRIYSELHPPCRPLALLARFERDNLEGADPMALAKTTLEIYHACFSRSRLMEKKIRRTAEIWRALQS
jgi:ADP-heptose:LPS heptosyltransferase